MRALLQPAPVTTSPPMQASTSRQGRWGSCPDLGGASFPGFQGGPNRLRVQIWHHWVEKTLNGCREKEEAKTGKRSYLNLGESLMHSSNSTVILAAMGGFSKSRELHLLQRLMPRSWRDPQTHTPLQCPRFTPVALAEHSSRSSSPARTLPSCAAPPSLGWLSGAGEWERKMQRLPELSQPREHP